MVQAVSVDMQARGGSQASAEASKVAEGIKKIAHAENEAAAAAHRRGQAQDHANRIGGSHHGAHPGGHSPFMHNLHAASFVGGETGHLAHSFSRAGRFGAIGIGASVAGMAGSAIMEAMEKFDESFKHVLEISEGISNKIREARKKFDEGALSNFSANRSAYGQLASQGASFEQIKDAQSKGIGPEGFAAIFGAKNREGTMAAAIAARRFGMDPGEAAKLLGAQGGVREGADAFGVAAELASLKFGRRIGSDEIARARAGEGELYGRIGAISGIMDRTDVAGIRGVEEGAAGRAAADRLNRTNSPDMAVMTDAFKEATERSESLQAIAEHTNSMVQILQNFTKDGGGATAQLQRFQREFGEGVQRVEAARE